MALKSYRVNREHEGDKFYRKGDLRKADDLAVRHLVEMGVLTVLGPAPKPRAKQAPRPSNKKAPPPANKKAPAASTK